MIENKKIEPDKTLRLQLIGITNKCWGKEKNKRNIISCKRNIKAKFFLYKSNSISCENNKILNNKQKKPRR